MFKQMGLPPGQAWWEQKQAERVPLQAQKPSPDPVREMVFDSEIWSQKRARGRQSSFFFLFL